MGITQDCWEVKEYVVPTPNPQPPQACGGGFAPPAPPTLASLGAPGLVGGESFWEPTPAGGLAEAAFGGHANHPERGSEFDWMNTDKDFSFF